MSLLETPTRSQPNAEDGARRIKQILFQTVRQTEHSLKQVHRIVEQHGRMDIATALGDDAADLHNVYQKLKVMVQNLDSSRDVPDLPD